MFNRTQAFWIRPTISEARREALISTDSHWTATLSKIGMTRISRTVFEKRLHG
jgi:hypothetical protein